MSTAPVKIGISRCLLGDEVRYDGTGARSSMPHDKLDGLFEYVDICPEMAIGMSSPRAPIRVVDIDGHRVIDPKEPDRDYAPDLRRTAEKFAASNDDLRGFIFMHNSPSCGSRRVKVYPEVGGPAARTGKGAFAAALISDWPCLPYEDAGRLFDDTLRENFVMRVFAYARWCEFLPNLSAKGLLEFHSAHKYLLMAHSQGIYKRAGLLLANLRAGPLPEIADGYIALLMEGLAVPATRGGHANTLAHIQGYLKLSLSKAARQELAQLIDEYRKGEQPLLAPIALLKHHFREHPNEYIEMQTYLEPHPRQAGLRRPL